MLAPRQKIVTRVFAHTGRTLGYALLFVLFVIVSALLHVDAPVARRLAAKQVSDGLASLFQGKIVLDHVDDIGVRGVRGADAYVAAPDGTKVIVAHGLRAKVSPLGLVRTIFSGKGTIAVYDIEVDDAEVVLDEDPSGGLKIARAFILAKPLPPSASNGQPPPVSVELSNIRIKHAWIHGVIKGAPILDGDADNVQASVHISNYVRVDAPHIDLKTRAMPANANAVGVVSAYVDLPSQKKNLIGFGGKFDGLVGRAPLRGSVDMDYPDWRFVVDVAEVDAARVREMLPSAPLYGPLAAHAEATGPLDALAVKAHAKLGGSTVDATAKITMSTGVLIDGHVDAQDVDVRSFAPTAPASKLGTHANVALVTGDGRPMHGSFNLTTPEGTIAGNMIPPTDLRGTFDESTATATGKVLEPGAPTDTTVTFHAAPGGGKLDVAAHTSVPSLAGVRRVGFIGAGQADVTTNGVITLAPTPTFYATARAVVHGFKRDVVDVGSATIEGHASGPFTAPAFEATVDARDIHAERFTWNDAHATASGSSASMGITVSAHGVQTPSVEGHATLAPGAMTTITDADLTLRRRTVGMHARIGKMRFGKGLTKVEDAELTGVGEPVRGSFESKSGVLKVVARSEGLNLHDIAYLFREDAQLKQGRASFAVDVHMARSHAEGTAKIAVTDLTWGSDYQGVALNADASLAGRDITGNGSLSMPRLGEMHVTYATIHVGGTGPLAQASWRSSWGDLALDGHVDIPTAVSLLPPGTLPKWTYGGALEIKAHTSRASEADDEPVIALSLQTRRLYVASLPSWELRGVDASVDTNVKGHVSNLSVGAADALGTIVTVDAQSNHLPWHEIFGDDPFPALMRQPVTADVHVPARELATLPLLFRPKFVRGFVQLDAKITGTALAPVVTVDGASRGTTFPELPDVRPLDIETHGAYAAKAGDVNVDISDAEEVFVHTTAHANGDLAMLIRGKEDPGWTASAHSKLLRFPLEAIPQLADRNIRGRLSGEVDLSRYHDDAHATATLTTERLTIGRTRFSKAALDAKYDGQNVDAHVRMEAKDGYADGTGKMAMSWGRELAPKPTPMGGLSLAVAAKNLQIAFLEPLLSSTVDELDGVVDGDARVQLALGEKPQMSGNMVLKDGRVIPSATGEELHGIGAKVSLAQDGTISLTDLVALGTSGKVTGKGDGHLAGLSLTDANVQLSIAKKDAMPLSLGGSVLGSGYGILSLGAKSSGSSTHVNIDVSTFHVDLPDATPRAVQDLEPPADNIHVGVRRSSGKIVTIGKTRNDIAQKKATDTPTTLEIAVHLGTIEIARGSDLRATLGGDTAMTVADKTTMRGQIIIRNGTLAVQGKPFDVQRGTATFVGDPQNPEINLTASWKASDGTEVFADYIGPLKTGKVVLRSEPPRPQNEIVSLILFGTADGSSSTPYAQQQGTTGTDTGSAAGTAVAGFATGGLNKGIDKLTGMDISTKIDTSQANPRPEVELRIARDLSLQIAFVLGTPPPGTNQDTTYATIDWRFYRNWSLATTFGDLGSSMADVLWRYRY